MELFMVSLVHVMLDDAVHHHCLFRTRYEEGGAKILRHRRRGMLPTSPWGWAIGLRPGRKLRRLRGTGWCRRRTGKLVLAKLFLVSCEPCRRSGSSHPVTDAIHQSNDLVSLRKTEPVFTHPFQQSFLQVCRTFPKYWVSHKNISCHVYICQRFSLLNQINHLMTKTVNTTKYCGAYCFKLRWLYFGAL